jgi:hypothetical protein
LQYRRCLPTIGKPDVLWKLCGNKGEGPVHKINRLGFLVFTNEPNITEKRELTYMFPLLHRFFKTLNKPVVIANLQVA